MSKSQRLRLKEVRAVYRLLGECRELGMDAVAWRRHMLAGLCRLVHAQVGLGCEARLVGRPKVMVPIRMIDTGWESEADRERYLDFQRQQVVTRLPVAQRFVRLPGHLVTLPRNQVVTDQEW